VKTVFVRQIQPDQVVQSSFLVQAKDLRQDKAGKTYLSMTLGDRSGSLDAKMWEGAAEAAPTFDRDDFIEAKGLVQVFRNRPQMTVHKLHRLDDEAIDFADYFPHTEKNVDEMWAELRAEVARMGNAHLRGLVEAFLDDPEVARRLRIAPAAKTLHHAVLGGLLEHVISLIRLCRAVAPNYPFVDPDLVLTGVVLHDLGKIYELNYDRTFSYSTEGQLIGHLVIMVRMLQEKAAADFPPKLKLLVEHLILSHHGKYEFGSPRLPLFPEALLLHYLDDMDSKLESMRATLAADGSIEGEWTGYNAALERTLLKKDKFLAGPKPEAAPPAARSPRQSAFGDQLHAALKDDGGAK